MPLSTVFQLSVYLLAAVSGLILAIAEGSALPAGITLPLAILTLIFVERRNSFHMSVAWANVCGILAFAAAAAEFVSDNLEARLLAGAHLLVYLSWIVLLQQKAMRQYWWMCALGVLQVAVASVLLTSGLFGAMLIGYVLLAVWTLSVFSLYQAESQFANSERYAVALPGAALAGVAAISRLPAVEAAKAFSAVASDAGTGTQWGGSQWGMTRGSIQLDPHESWINGRFVVGVMTTAVLSMMLGMVFFLLIPRLWVGQLPFSTGTPIRGRNITGFSEEVRLGDIGEILESNEPVMEVLLVDQTTNEALDVEQFAFRQGYDEPLFRGAVLNEYSEGRWSHRMQRFDPRVLRPMPVSPTDGPAIRQRIKLYPLGSRIVFAIHPVVACSLDENSERMRYDAATGVIMLPDRQRIGARAVEYSAFSLKTAGPESQGSAVPGSSWYESGRNLSPYRQLPGRRLERLRRKASEIAGVGPRGEARLPQQEMADRLVSYLRDSGEFTYSLNSSITDSSIDPIEDFLFNRRTGHCEYFASAMALMLRSVGIPSRLITGFKGGVTNQLNGSFVVEQRHAHAWVEAYLDDRWVTIDAIPEGRDASVKQLDPAVPTWRDLKQVLAGLWGDKVARLNYGQQETMLYAPIKNAIAALWANLRRMIEHLVGAGRSWLTSPEAWFSWRGWLAAFVFLWGTLLIFRGAAFALRRLWTWRKQWRTRRIRLRKRVPFYERFQHILKSHGIQRRPEQTPGEFAAAAVRRLRPRLAAQGLEDFPPQLIRMFYGVRFGNEQLSPGEAQHIDDALNRLAACLANGTPLPDPNPRGNGKHKT